ncbi:uncharacterized protein CANTADRAFT_6189 [Suhomyces tanzawaensis NRRL Y-17324]|uniref:Dystroglycan-type cadherin-like domain-containing protein n=1 Tax=Suhomyces tanzawaensis NRRL Y-17324 TaxID=984487 RepID=A0A1E4SHK4_9ASCO|nr:uncharacterized protein CANTADRAFT_6189 [Suhomyces tanzawaensis NRRL Y-17324]ODV78994.1 hypothetical protein CANTADRAFT_6189 [Suhomyces tanzawaensis NRRL Y-17324]
MTTTDEQSFYYCNFAPRATNSSPLEEARKVLKQLPNFDKCVITLFGDGTEIVEYFDSDGNQLSKRNVDAGKLEEPPSDPIIAGNLKKSQIEARINRRLGGSPPFETLTYMQRKIVLMPNKKFDKLTDVGALIASSVYSKSFKNLPPFDFSNIKSLEEWYTAVEYTFNTHKGMRTLVENENRPFNPDERVFSHYPGKSAFRVYLGFDRAFATHLKMNGKITDMSLHRGLSESIFARLNSLLRAKFTVAYRIRTYYEWKLKTAEAVADDDSTPDPELLESNSVPNIVPTKLVDFLEECSRHVNLERWFTIWEGQHILTIISHTLALAYEKYCDDDTSVDYGKIFDDQIIDSDYEEVPTLEEMRREGLSQTNTSYQPLLLTTRHSFSAPRAMLFLLVFQAAIQAVAAQVYVGFPFSEQLPNVARTGQPYSFTVSDSTYRSTNGPNNINYYTGDLPSWLSFDKQSRTFSGTPAASDVGNFEVALSGYDTSDGTSMTNQVSMVVSADSGLHLSSGDAMFVEIAKYGQTNGNDGLVVKQGQQFTLKFDKSVFESNSNASRPIIAYYGRSQDRSPLPPWIRFDADDLSFVGTVPQATSENAPSYEYAFGFIASDYYGFAGAEGVFKLIVGGHQLSTSLNETIKLNGTLNDNLTVTVPIFSNVYLDGAIISQQNISRVYADNLPDYLSLNTNNYSITGKLPSSETFDNFTVQIEDVYHNTVELPYSVDAIDSVFTLKNLPDVNATKGQWFSYQLLDSYFTDINNTKISVDYSSADWLTYHQENKTLVGATPDSFDKLSVDVSASSSFDTELKSFQISGVSRSSSSSSSSPSSSSSSEASSSASNSGSAAAAPHSKSSSGINHKALAIGLGVGIPAFFLLIGALLLFCCCARRRKDSNDDESTEVSDVASNFQELTGPGFGTTVDKDDHNEDARQLSTLNVLNLDKKAYDNEDVKSTSSSVTHVGSVDDERFFDASEKPVKSWRAKDGSDVALAAKDPKRVSQASLSTVNTEQLFSVRLVDDVSRRNSNQSSSLQSKQFLSNNSLNGLLTRSSSGNIQRLDSDGNIVETLNATNPTTIEKPRLSRSASTNLDVLVEENSKDYNTSSLRHDDSTTYHSTKFARDDTETSSFDLLAKFNESRHPSQANSENDLRNLSNYSMPDPDYDEELDQDVLDEFKATKVSDGEFKWEENSGNITTSSINAPINPHHNTSFESPSSDHFIFSSSDQTPTTLRNSPMKNNNLSALSLGSANSESLLIGNNKQAASSDITLNNRHKAKLVDFTRKGSLRESAYEPDYHYQGQTAQIHEDDFSD